MIETHPRRLNTPRQVLFASLVGTTVEFFDFYIYATAAVLVFPRLFFPASDPASSTLASLATFAIAFIARPIGSALFGDGCAAVLLSSDPHADGPTILASQVHQIPDSRGGPELLAGLRPRLLIPCAGAVKRQRLPRSR